VEPKLSFQIYTTLYREAYGGEAADIRENVIIRKRK
jgi:hypothetical protein